MYFRCHNQARDPWQPRKGYLLQKTKDLLLRLDFLVEKNAKSVCLSDEINWEMWMSIFKNVFVTDPFLKCPNSVCIVVVVCFFLSILHSFFLFVACRYGVVGVCWRLAISLPTLAISCALPISGLVVNRKLPHWSAVWDIGFESCLFRELSNQREFLLKSL